MYLRSLLPRSATEVKTPRANHVALDLGKPELDLVEPGGIGRGEMKAHVGMLGEEPFDLFGLVRGEIVEHDVNLLAHPVRATKPSRKAMNSLLVCRAAVMPCTWPVFTSSAAYSDSVPWR